MKFEHIKQPIAPRAVFFARLARSLGLAAAVVAASLFAGMWGYHRFGHVGWMDAFANASMILSGMGPLSTLDDGAGKLFEGLYSLYSGFVVLVATSLVLAPVLHRFLHQMHLAEEDESSDG